MAAGSSTAAGMHPDIHKVLFSSEQLQQRNRALGRQLAAVFQGDATPVVVLCVLKGAFMFASGIPSMDC